MYPQVDSLVHNTIVGSRFWFLGREVARLGRAKEVRLLLGLGNAVWSGTDESGLGSTMLVSVDYSYCSCRIGLVWFGLVLLYFLCWFASIFWVKILVRMEEIWSVGQIGTSKCYNMVDIIRVQFGPERLPGTWWTDEFHFRLKATFWWKASLWLSGMPRSVVRCVVLMVLQLPSMRYCCFASEVSFH